MTEQTTKKAGMKRIAFVFLLFVLLTVLWWAALWLALPVEWLQSEPPAFVLLHIAPPVLALAAGWAGKWAWGWRKTRANRLADERKAAGKRATQDAAYASHLVELARLRAHLECRGVWQELPLEVARGIGGESVLLSLLQRVFSRALSQCEALAWLPVYVLSGRGAEESVAQLIQQAMLHAVTMTGVENPPPQPECIPLPGSGNLADRLIALFDNNPALPAAILVGIDSPLGEAQQVEDSDSSPECRPEHTVVAALLSRPGLAAPDAAQIARIEAIRNQANNPMTPHWEREQARGENPDQATLNWGNMPLPMQLAFLKNLPPVAALHRTNTIQNPAPKNSVLTRQFQDAIQKALIHAGLRELPFKSEEPQDEQTKPTEKPKPEEPKPLELGWLVHNADPGCIGALASSLGDFGCELDLFAESSNLEKEVGDAGATRSVLMLAEALTRAAQLQQPVLVAEFEGTRRVAIGMTCPVTQKASTGTKTPDLSLEAAA